MSDPLRFGGTVRLWVAARIAWVGIRPLATSWPPDLRTAEPNGAAQVVLPDQRGSRAARLQHPADLLDVRLGEKHCKIRLRRAQLADLAVVSLTQLRLPHGPVQRLW